MNNRYYSRKKFIVNLQDQEIEVVSKPGIPDWDRLSNKARLLADNAQVDSDSRILLLGCGHGALGVFLARKAFCGNVILMDTSIIALNIAKSTLEIMKLLLRIFRNAWLSAKPLEISMKSLVHSIH